MYCTQYQYLLLLQCYGSDSISEALCIAVVVIIVIHVLSTILQVVTKQPVLNMLKIMCYFYCAIYRLLV